MTEPTPLDRKLLAATERLGRALRAARQQLATRHHLSLLQLQIVEQLADERLRRIGDLAAELDVSQPTVSDALGALEQKGFATRRPDPGDRRATTIALTPAGSALAELAATELAPLLATNETTSADDRATALRVLLTEIARLQHAGVITVNRSCLTCHHYQPPRPRTLAHCHLLDQPLTNHDLRVDCPEHATPGSGRFSVGGPVRSWQ